MSMPTKEMLIGACAARGVDRTGTQEELHRRLGDHLVSQLFSGADTSGAKRPVAASAGASTPSTAKTGTSTSSTGKRPATAWHAFQRSEKERVKQAGFHGRVAIVQETARRWKLFKQVGTSDAPLMLHQTSVPDGLLEAIAELSDGELSDALEAQGIEDAGEREDKIAALVRAMMA